MKVTFTRTPAPATTYAPANAIAVWIQDQAGAFVKTAGQFVDIRQQHLVAWQQAAGLNDTDADSGASKLDLVGPLTVIWNLRDRQGNVVPDGTYTIRLELAQDNSTQPGQNNQGTFTFIKGPAPQMQTGLTNGGFINVSIEFDPNAVACADGTVDGPEEKCDRAIAEGMPGACPATCAVEDACRPVQLQGDPMLCSAECVAGEPITACIGGDGCCAEGCGAAEDSDCIDPGPPVPSGGCATGGGPGGALALGALGLALLLRRRRR